MDSSTLFSTSYDCVTSCPVGLQEVKLEFHCYTEDRPDYSPVNDARHFRKRTRPLRRPSLARGHSSRGNGEDVHREVLKTASRIMVRKNQAWLSREDLITNELDDLSPHTFPRRHPWLGTIPDGEPATITCSSSQEGLDDRSVPIIPSLAQESSSSSSSTVTQELWTETHNSSFLQVNSTSSGTSTPSSDVTWSPITSAGALCIPTVSRSSDGRSTSPSPSFIMCRGDSVDGLFISSPPKCISPTEVSEDSSSPTVSQQSPFRRQLFKSLMTRQSALVSRVTQHSCRLLETLAAVASADLHYESRHASGSAPLHDSSSSISSGEFVQASSVCCTMNEDTCRGRASKLHPKVHFVGNDLEDFSDPVLARELRASRLRMAEQVSVCDSGVSMDTDDDQRSLSRDSLSMYSEGSEGTMEDEQVLCGNRVSQMTKTYNDIDAVTRLLQEKEKDLELAAKIGQQLLNRNKALEERNATLESEVSAAGEKITQLRHDLQMKTDLLAIYTNDVDDTSSCETTPTGVRLVNVDILQHRVKNLEEENKTLRLEASQLASDTLECEDKEKELVSDVIKQLSDANLQVSQLSEELAKKVEDSLRQQEEITQLLAQVVDLQARNKRLVAENDELANMVGVARDCQQELTMELAELKEKYAEVLDLLHDTQDQLRRVQKKNQPGSRGHHLSNSLFSSPFNSGNDSIASELHSLSSMGEETGKETSNNMRRTFDTVRLTGKYTGLGSQGSLSSLGYGGSVHSTPTHHPHTPSHMATPTHMASSGGTYAMSYIGSRGSSVYSGGSGHPSLDSGADSDASVHTDSEDNYPGSHLGVPGWPGTPDLDSCLRRLGPANRSGTPSQFLPYGCRTPDSIMSTGSGKSGLSAYGSNNDWRLPQKLQIVKPIEGSLTLHQWSRLATPHLGGLLEEREGVAIKGGAGAEQLNLEVYSMSDLEEDEVEEENPGKRFMSTSGVFTYTNSTILHPDDQTNSTPSLRQAQVSVLLTSATSATPAPSTPIRAPSCPPSRRGSTATFSTNTGLAKVLNERGMNRQSGFSPTATPANSPTNSKPGSPEPEGYKLPGLEDLTKTFHYGASLLRRTFYKDDPSAPQSPVGPRVNLVKQVQAIGVDRFVGSSGRALTVGGVVMSRPATSPLLHLSNLIMSSAKNCSTSSTTSSSTTTTTSSASSTAGIMSAPKVLSPGERRPTLPSGAPMGIPGHPGSGHLDNRLSQLKPGQRADLGTVGSRPRPTSLHSVPLRGSGEQNVGTVGWTSFGRKGGLL